MSKINWTVDQSKAISADNTSCLVSAAAGSGKTAVLIERIVKKLEKTDIDKFVIVTFTEAAAEQMKQGIKESVKERISLSSSNEEKGNLRRQLLLLNDANISTMHSFCSRLIRNNFDTLEIPSDFSIIQPEDKKILFKKAYDEVCDSLFEDKNEEFLNLVSNYENVHDGLLFSMVTSLFNASESLPYPDEWLDMSLNNLDKDNFLNAPWFKKSLELCSNELKKACANFRPMEKLLIDNPQLEKLGAYSQELNMVENIIKVLSSPVTDYSKFLLEIQPNFERFTPYKKEVKLLPEADKFKEKRTEFKKEVESAVKTNFFLSEKALKKTLEISYNQAKALIYIVRKTRDAFDTKKREQNVLDYNDLEHFAIRLLTNEDHSPSVIAKNLSLQYEEIIIDEYQDTNPVQEVIFSAISKDGKNLFMVGDMKQSIYKFRNADPSIFNDKLAHFDKDGNEKGTKIFLSQNFRSRKNILDFSNLVFGQTMNKVTGETVYSDNEKLYFGNVFDENDSPVEIILTDKDDESTYLKGTEKEAYLIGAKIQKMIDDGTVLGKDEKVHNATYKDFAILLRNAKGNISKFASVLTNMGIPVFVDDNAEYLLSSYEIKVILSFLKVIDNPYDDISFVAVLKSPLFSLSDDSLGLISKVRKDSFYEKAENIELTNKSENIKLSSMLESVKKYQKLQKHLSVGEIVREIVFSTNFYEYASNMTGGKQRKSNLDFFVALADNYETDSFKGLYKFISFIENYDDKTASMVSPKNPPENQNAVTITTIHKSKGLEYNVVIVPRLGGVFNLKGTGLIESHRQFGFGFDPIDSSLSYMSPVRIALKNIMVEESVSEEMRVFYVALTRAKERLILVADIEKEKIFTKYENVLEIEDFSIPPYITNSARSFIDWIMMALIRTESTNSFKNELNMSGNSVIQNALVNVHFSSVEDIAVQSKNEKTNEETDNFNDDKEIEEILSYKYPHTATEVYSKYSVSDIKKSQQDTNFKVSLSAVSTNEETGLTPSEKGTLIHLIFEKAILSKCRNEEDVKICAEKLLEAGTISQKEFNEIPFKNIEKFFETDIGKKVSDSDNVYTESTFEISVDAETVNPEAKGREILIQGIIDLYFKENDTYVIIDYKSDKVTENNYKERAQEYKIQLELYKKALSEMYNTSNVKSYLYFVEINKFAEI